MNLRFHTPPRKNAIVLFVLILMLAFFASTPLQGSAADAGKGAQVINKAPSPVHLFRKFVNGEDANSPGLVITEGTAITWTYYVENVGSASLSNIHITDDNGTPNYTDDDFTVCIIDKLSVYLGAFHSFKFGSQKHAHPFIQESGRQGTGHCYFGRCRHCFWLGFDPGGIRYHL